MEYMQLNDGRKIPAVGFGCYNPKGGDNYTIISDAIKAGYRFFDTASLYETERDLGRAIKDSGIPREEFFIQTKMWIDEMGYEESKAALSRSLERLQTDYVDIYLMHWPRSLPEYEGAPGHPEVIYKNPEYTPDPDWKKVQADTCRALDEMYDEGRIRGIGLSNFLPHHIMNVEKCLKHKPAVVQLELHIGYTQPTAVNYAKDHGLLVQAWSPLGRSDVLNEPFFIKMAEKYKVSTAQLGLRFLYQMGILPLPKSSSPDRQKQNLDIFDFEISEEDYYLIACMVPTCWQREHPDFVVPSKACRRDQ